MRIAVAVDGSENALRAVEHAILLAKYLPDVKLEFIHVVDISRAKDDYLLVGNMESLTLQQGKMIQPARDLAEKAGIEAKVTVLKGNPRRKIIRYVKENAIDQLIVGSRGLNLFQELMLGSVSYRVMKHAICPVTIVK